MNCFIFLGPPGAGKGTQSALLQERLGFTHISTGALIRKEISSNSELGKSVKSIVESGHYVDDTTIIECLKNHLKSLDENSKTVVLLDGIPRNLYQAETLNKFFGDKLKGVLALTANLERLVERFSKRFQCTNCSRVLGLDIPPLSEFECPACHMTGTFKRRKDDEPEIVRERFKVYEQQTENLLEFYKKHKMLYEFDALQPVEHIYVNLAALILQKIDGKC